MGADGLVVAFGLAPADCDERPIGGFVLSSGGYDASPVDKGLPAVQ